MHLAGVPTAVASCGTAFGAEHVSVIRRLMGDDSFDHGEVIYTFDGDAAGQAAALKAFDGDQSFAAQTFVCDRAERAGPVRPAAERRRHRGARPGGPPRAAVRVRHPLDAARARPRHRRGPRGGAAALRAARGPDQAGGPARRVRPPARRLDGLGRLRDGRPPGAGDGRARRPSGRVRPSGPGAAAPRRPAPAPAARGAQGRAAGAGDRRARATTSCPSRRSRTRRTSRCTGRSRPPAGCAAGGRVRRGWTPWSPSARPRSAGWSASWPSSRSSCR